MKDTAGAHGANGDSQAHDGIGWTPANIYVLGILTVVYAINMVDRQIIGLMIPLIKSDLRLSDTVLGLISGFAFALFYAIAAMPFASLADRWSRRNIIAFGLAAWSIVMALHGAARSAVQLAIARLLLGVGEATATPASNSIIADLFRPSQRAFALGFQSAAASIGVLIAYPAIGYVSGAYGWRAGFAAAGVPGIFVAVLFYLTVREPRRGQSDEAQSDEGPTEALPLRVALRRLFATPGFLPIILTGGFAGFSMAIMLTWAPTFLSRVHGLTQAEIGTSLGLLRGTGGVAGALIGGWLATWLGRKDWRWRYRIPALSMLLVAPAQLLLLFGSDGAWQFGLALETVLVMAQFGPMFALLLAASDSRTRAVATACFIVLVNILGQGGGPLIAGGVSDFLAPSLGQEAIRYALLTAVAGTLLAGTFCYLGGKRIAGLRHG